MITWPDATLFPAPSVDFSINVNTSTVRTKMDSGRVRQRARFTRNFRQLPASWKLSDEEYGLFQSIYTNGLNRGADWFLMSLPLGDNGFKTYTVRFVADSFTAKHDGVLYWNVSARLETEEQVEPMDSETIEAYNAIGFDIAAFEAAVAGLTEVTALS